MHDAILYDPIQGQYQGHKTLKIENLWFSKSVSSDICNGSKYCGFL